jgi:hypothetical protein
VDRPWPCNGSPRGASLGTPFPLLAQKVLELVHQLLRVKVVLTPWARRLVTRRVIVLLSLPYIGLDGGVFRYCLVTLGPKGPRGRLEGGHIQLQVEQVCDRGQQRATHGRIGCAPEVMGRLPSQGERGETTARRRIQDDRGNAGRAFVARATRHPARLQPRVPGGVGAVARDVRGAGMGHGREDRAQRHDPLHPAARGDVQEQGGVRNQWC